MSVEYSINVPVILLIVAFCVCFMLRFHNIVVKQTISTNEEVGNPTKVIRISDAIIDAFEEREKG